MARPIDGKSLTVEELELVLELHKQGVSSVKIGRQFNRDHSTITYHIKKFRELGVLSMRSRTYPPLPREPEPETYPYQHTIEEKVNPGKSYRQYLKEAQKKASDKEKHFYRMPSQHRNVVDNSARLLF